MQLQSFSNGFLKTKRLETPLIGDIWDSIIESSTCENLLGIKIDPKLRFDDHMQDLCNKAN